MAGFLRLVSYRARGRVRRLGVVAIAGSGGGDTSLLSPSSSSTTATAITTVSVAMCTSTFPSPPSSSGTPAGELPRFRLPVIDDRDIRRRPQRPKAMHHRLPIRAAALENDSGVRGFRHAMDQLFSPGTLDLAGWGDLVRRCGDQKNIDDAKRVHCHLIESGTELDKLTHNLIVELYGKCKSVDDSLRQFNSITEKNIQTWNMMIIALCSNGRLDEAFSHYLRMHQDVNPDRFTFSPLLLGVSDKGSLLQGKLLHGRMAGRGLHNSTGICSFTTNINLESSLLMIYCKLSELAHAKAIFDRIFNPSPYDWGSIIEAYVRNSRAEEAYEIYRQWEYESPKNNQYFFQHVFGMFGSRGDVVNGRVAHLRMFSSGIRRNDKLIAALDEMYVKFGDWKERLCSSSKSDQSNKEEEKEEKKEEAQVELTSPMENVVVALLTWKGERVMVLLDEHGGLPEESYTVY